MRTLPTTLFLGFWLIACQRTSYHYVVTAPTELFEIPFEQSPVLAHVQRHDTLLTHKRIRSADTHFIKVLHRSTRGYVRAISFERLDSIRYQTAYGRWVRSLRFNPELSFRFHFGGNNSKPTGSLQAYRAHRSAGSTRSASPTDRRVGSGSRTGGGRGPR